MPAAPPTHNVEPGLAELDSKSRRGVYSMLSPLADIYSGGGWFSLAARISSLALSWEVIFAAGVPVPSAYLVTEYFRRLSSRKAGYGSALGRATTVVYSGTTVSGGHSDPSSPAALDTVLSRI